MHNQTSTFVKVFKAYAALKKIADIGVTLYRYIFTTESKKSIDHENTNFNRAHFLFFIC
jgi:hypothetical protein